MTAERRRLAGPGESRAAVIASLAGDTAIAVTKFIAAIATGSSAMIAEGIHSVVDAANSLLLLLGMHRSRKPPDVQHPFGHGQELYFWTFIVAVVIFGIGGGLSVYEGITRVLHPEPLGDLTWSYIVLAAAMVFQLASSTVAFRQFRRVVRGQGIFHAAHASKDPTIFAVVFEDAAGVLGLVIAFLGIFLGTRLHVPVLDGVASIFIGIILAAVAVFLAHENRSLLVGESADPRMVDALHQLVADDPSVVRMSRPLTMYFGPQHVLLALDIQFHTSLSASDVAAAVERLERKIRERFPVIKQIYIEARALAAREPEHTQQAGRSSPRG